MRGTRRQDLWNSNNNPIRIHAKDAADRHVGSRLAQPMDDASAVLADLH